MTGRPGSPAPAPHLGDPRGVARSAPIRLAGAAAPDEAQSTSDLERVVSAQRNRAISR
jgi:hypothetical protein